MDTVLPQLLAHGRVLLADLAPVDLVDLNRSVDQLGHDGAIVVGQERAVVVDDRARELLHALRHVGKCGRVRRGRVGGRRRSGRRGLFLAGGEGEQEQDGKAFHGREFYARFCYRRASVIIECSDCRARYQYDEDRFERKPSKKIKCAKCGTVFEIHNPAFASKPAPAEVGESTFARRADETRTRELEKPKPETTETSPLPERSTGRVS